MEFRHPKYYAELRKQGRATAHKQELTSSQAGGDKHPNQRTRVQASSHKPQAPGSDDQGTSAQAHGPGCKRQE